MSKLKIAGKELRAIGYPEGPVVSIAMRIMEKNYKHSGKEEAMEILKIYWLHRSSMKMMRCWV